jgi:hypothetical protein
MPLDQRCKILEHNVGFEPTPVVYKTTVLPIKLIMLETNPRQQATKEMSFRTFLIIAVYLSATDDFGYRSIPNLTALENLVARQQAHQESGFRHVSYQRSNPTLTALTT